MVLERGYNAALQLDRRELGHAVCWKSSSTAQVSVHLGAYGQPVIGQTRPVQVPDDPDLSRGFAQVMGWTLSQALTSALRRAADAKACPAEFSKEFAGLVGIADNGYLVSLDTLADKTTDAVQAFQAIVTSHSESAGVLWACVVTGRLRQTAVAVFDRREQLTPSGATSVRLAALCLAAEADAQDQRQLGDAFREIAVGITLLERRTGGDGPAPETILLATE